MKSLLILGTLLLVLATVILVVDNAADISEGHDDQTDIDNAKSELERYNGLIVEYSIERNRLVAAIYAGSASFDSSTSGMRTIIISALGSIASKNIANALGLAVRAFLGIHGGTTLQSFIDTLISDANTLTESINYLYNNTTRLWGVDSANSAIEAYMDLCTATDHYNDNHHYPKNAPIAPNEPDDPELPKFICPGVCGQTFTTAGGALNTHYTKCGTGDNIDDLIQTWTISGSSIENVLISAILELKSRSVDKGCGRDWYTCESDHATKTEQHKVRTCKKWVYRYDAHLSTRPPAKSKCVEYRGCMEHTFDHNNRVPGKSLHSDEADSDEEANAGGTTPTPTMHACNIHDASDSGDHSSTYLCNESPCSNRSVSSCLANCPYTDTHGTTTPTTPAMVVCDIEGCQDSTPYDATSSSAGLHAYCNECSQYKCNGVDHSWQTSCTDTTHTNSNGDSCTVAGYECVSHTPVYPAPPPTTVSCGGCSVSYDPQGSLAWRHEYIPCPRTRIAHDLACGASFYRCSNTNTCIWNWRHSSWNDDPEL